MAYTFEAIIFIFVGIGFFSFADLYKQVHPLNVVATVGLILFARGISVIIISSILNIKRSHNRIDPRRMFFIFFAGVRGSMAFALALKSLTDFGEIGEVFVIITLIYVAFSLFYSSLFTPTIIKKCDILMHEDEVLKFRKSATADFIEKQPDSCFKSVKKFFHNLHKKQLLSFVKRPKDLSEITEPLVKEEIHDFDFQRKEIEIFDNKYTKFVESEAQEWVDLRVESQSSFSIKDKQTS